MNISMFHITQNLPISWGEISAPYITRANASLSNSTAEDQSQGGFLEPRRLMSLPSHRHIFKKGLSFRSFQNAGIRNILLLP